MESGEKAEGADREWRRRIASLGDYLEREAMRQRSTRPLHAMAQPARGCGWLAFLEQWSNRFYSLARSVSQHLAQHVSFCENKPSRRNTSSLRRLTSRGPMRARATQGRAKELRTGPVLPESVPGPRFSARRTSRRSAFSGLPRSFHSFPVVSTQYQLKQSEGAREHARAAMLEAEN